MSKAKHNPRYEYTEFNRRDTPEGRRYLTPDGELVASVTTISSNGAGVLVRRKRKRS